MKRILGVGGAVLVIFLLGWLTNFYWKNFRGAGPAVRKPSVPIAETFNTTGMPLAVSPGFSVSIFAKDLPGARVMRFDALGNLWVSQTSEGLVTLLEIRDGKVVSQQPVFKNLRKPHGLAFDPASPFTLFIAEEHRIARAGVYSEAPLEPVIDLPDGGGHFTRTIGFGPDGRLYVSIGSSCNVCNEEDARRAKMFSMKSDGGDFREYARGLRNTVFFAWHPETGDLWGTDMGRDLLGDDLPPDEVNIIKGGGNYGWPVCYGKNVHDTEFDKNIYLRNPCEEPFETSSWIDIPAHSAPLGLAFIPAREGWPEEYRNNLLVAYHGSWNRSVPTGYKVVRYTLDPEGRVLGVEDFISGWLRGGEALGRPADIAADPKEPALYISDDKAGVIYKVEPVAPSGNLASPPGR